MNNLRDEYLDFKELRESNIKTLITDLSKRNKGISKANLLKMLSVKDRKEYKDANFFQVLDVIVDQTIKTMKEESNYPEEISQMAFDGSKDDSLPDTGGEGGLEYSPQENGNNFYLEYGENNTELVGGGNTNSI